MRISLTKRAHELVEEHLYAGDIAIDATVGNGHDTLFLSRVVGENGMVFGFDIQQLAIDSARLNLATQNFQGQTTIFLASHSEIKKYLPTLYHGKIKVIMFNLGYLPGSDKSTITKANTTLTALNHSIGLLADNGIITIIAYPGHTGGEKETGLIRQWYKQLDSELYSSKIIYSSDKNTAPRLIIIQKTSVFN